MTIHPDGIEIRVGNMSDDVDRNFDDGLDSVEEQWRERCSRCGFYYDRRLEQHITFRHDCWETIGNHIRELQTRWAETDRKLAEMLAWRQSAERSGKA